MKTRFLNVNNLGDVVACMNENNIYFSNKLSRQKKFNRWVAIFAAVTVVKISLAELRNAALSDEVKKLNKEIEELKKVNSESEERKDK